MIFANHWVAKKIAESFPSTALVRISCNGCYCSCVCKQSFFCFQLHTDEAKWVNTMETDPLASFKASDNWNNSNCVSPVHLRSVPAALHRAQLFIILVALSSVSEETTFCKFNSLCRCQGIFHRYKVKVVGWGTVKIISPVLPFPGSNYGLVCQWRSFVSNCLLDRPRPLRLEKWIEDKESNTIEGFSNDCRK